MKVNYFSAWLAAALWVGAALASSGCGDDKDDHGSGESNLVADCKTISEACHDHDDGSGPKHECHEVAHENDADMCADKKDGCLEACGHEH